MSRGSFGQNDSRTAIAAVAARLIAEGQTDYHSAKRKAAKQLGAPEGCELPDNHEIEAALRKHFELFEGASQPAALAALREVALRALRWLAAFEPWICGAVLLGTANENSAIELELVGIEPKEFEIFLLNANVPYNMHGGAVPRHSGRSRRTRGADTIIRYELELHGAPLSVSLFESHQSRQARYPKNSLWHDRAQLSEAIKRFAASDKKSGEV